VEHSRRRFLHTLTATSAAAMAACGEPPPADTPSLLGGPVSAYGQRSPLEQSARRVAETTTPEEASSRTPLQDLNGMIRLPVHG